MNKIDSFSGEYAWLSNFHPCEIHYEGFNYPSVENAYQASKAPPDERSRFFGVSPGKAKRLGKIYNVTPFGRVHILLPRMKLFLDQKFSQGSALALQLRLTGDAELIEGNTWGDEFWGVCNGKGLNHLGRLLMARRSVLQGRQ